MILNNDKQFDFSTPRRQSQIGVVMETAAALYRFLKAFWALLLILFLNPAKYSIALVVLVPILVLAFFFLYGYLAYRNLLFHIDEGTEEFVLQEGILNKKRTIISLDRIQQASINQNFLQRLLKIYAVHVSTAGSKDNELTIKAVDYALAQQLKKRLYSRSRERMIEESVPRKQTEAGMSIGVTTLTKVAITSDYNRTFAVILWILATVYNSFMYQGKKSPEEEFKIFASFDFSSLFNYFSIFVVAVLLFIFFFNLIRVLITYFNYEITLNPGAISFSFGLFNTKSVVMYRDKVQIVRVVTNYFQKKMGLVRVFFHQATSDEVQDKQAVIQVPGCTSAQREQLLLQVFSDLPSAGTTYIPNVRKIIMLSIKAGVIPCLFLVALAHFTSQSLYLYLLPVWLLLAFVIITFSFRNSKLTVSPQFIQIQRGMWDISTRIIEPRKIQAITTKQMLWHRRANVGHIKLHTAAGIISFKYGNFEKMNTLVNRWLFDVETSRKKWM